MAADIKFTDTEINVEGALGVNEPKPKRSLHVTGQEIHSGGAGAGFSFSARDKGFVDVPANGERWVWYGTAGSARLWSGKDHVTINSLGHVQAFITSTIRPFTVQGYSRLGRPPAVWLQCQDVILTRYIPDGAGGTKPAYADDKALNNYALSHMDGDQLVINRKGGYTGGVKIEGKVLLGDTDLLAELAALRAELDALKAKVK